MSRVKLEWYEIGIASYVGVCRREESKNDGRKNQHGLEGDEKELIEIDIEGAAKEMAAAKAMNRYWPGSINAPKSQADVGKSIQVRGSEHKSGCLIVRKKDPGDFWYVLVTGHRNTGYNVVGYIRGSEAKKDEYRRAPNGRPEAWFVPQSKLRKV